MSASTRPLQSLHDLLQSSDATHRAQARELLASLQADEVRQILSDLPSLRGMNLATVDLSACALAGKDLEGANLSQTNLQGVDLQGARLDGADLRGADLRGANLSGQTLWWLDLSDADLRGADLHGAQLHHACLCRSSLIQANIESLKLSFCRVEGLDLAQLPAEVVGLWGGEAHRLPLPLGGPSAVAAMAWVPAGSFWMGSPDSDPDANDNEKPQHEVAIPQGFWAMTTPVTQRLWQEVTGSNPSDFKGDERCPVEQVSWCDAVVFANMLSQREGLKPAYKLPPGFALGMDHDTCNHLHSEVVWDRAANSYRLPTEAEWEYMARAGTTTRYWSGDTEADLARVGWYNGNSGGISHPVGEKKAPNPWGLHDIHGNVWEWCFDTYDNTAYQSKTNIYPVFSSGALRVVRGGSWLYSPNDARAAYRFRNSPGFCWDYLGVRLVRSAVPQR